MGYLLFTCFQSRVVLYRWASSTMRKIQVHTSQEPASRWLLSSKGSSFLSREENHRLIEQLSLEKNLRGYLVQTIQGRSNLDQNIALPWTLTGSSRKTVSSLHLPWTVLRQISDFLKEIRNSLRIGKKKMSDTFQGLNTASKIGILKNKREDKLH